MARVESFPPIAGPSARTLILGTMPGVASLAAGQYYAHPRNAFWSILGELLGFDPQLPYAERAQHLIGADIAVWDVLRTCVRPGSLDARIEPESIVANDFARFFADHPGIVRVCFNGGNAETLYRRHVRKRLADDSTRQYVRLPSTSPANASWTPAAKLRGWRTVLTPTLHGARRTA